MTIEDETAIANIIVWPKTFERFRPIILGARYVAVTGEVQRESNVIHVVASKLDDLTRLLARLTEDAPPMSRSRAPTRSSARMTRTSTAAHAAVAIRRASPRRRNSRILWPATSTFRRAARRTHPPGAAARRSPAANRIIVPERVGQQAPRLVLRHHAIAADIDPRSLERSVRLLYRGRRGDGSAGLELAQAPDFIPHDRARRAPPRSSSHRPGISR